jgi:uncharacterized protein with ATP-grasp and redox domains
VKTLHDCIPCFMRQTLEAARQANNSEFIHEKALRRIANEISRMDLDRPPPIMGGIIHRTVRELTQNEDPYKNSKDICNRSALELYAEMSDLVSNSTDPLETALKIAIAGNVIDFSISPDADQLDIRSAVEEVLSQPLHAVNVNQFREAVKNAQAILYLGDNAGEIVFDRILIEQLPADKLTYVVKGYPTINDVTMDDAHVAGITDLIDVIDTGSDIPGVVLDECSGSFRSRFLQTDLIISKGQGNYECLSDMDKDIFFVFKAKCASIANQLGCEIGKAILIRSTCE